MDLESNDNPLNTVAFPYQLSNIFNKYNALEELDLAKKALETLYSSVENIKEYELNDSYGKRTLIKI